ncbi:MAG: hypothetical protein Q9182_006181 [Xanthomendoza sp. 2 TL-2023]
MHIPTPLILLLTVLSNLDSTAAIDPPVTHAPLKEIPVILSNAGWRYQSITVGPLPVYNGEQFAVLEMLQEAQRQRPYKTEDLDWGKLYAVLMEWGWRPPKLPPIIIDPLTNTLKLLRARQTPPPEPRVSIVSAAPCMLSRADDVAGTPASACPEEDLQKMSSALSKHGWHFEPTATPAIPSSPGPLPELEEEIEEMKSILTKWGWVHDHTSARHQELQPRRTAVPGHPQPNTMATMTKA